MTLNERSLVKIERQGEVALLLLNNPPVNALSDALRADIMAALDEVEKDSTLRAAVIACEGRTFIVGADITQFGKPREILTATIAARISGMHIPFVAALHGTTLGGGCEISLGCHARVIDRAGYVGLPEVKIGLVPSGGGTQRITRLVGSLIALDLISTGRQVPAEEALTLGIVDEVADDVRAAAIALAVKLAASGRGRRIGERSYDPVEVAEFRRRADSLKRRAGAALAMRRGIEAVEFALTHTLEEGVALEQCISAEVHAAPQSHAMRYLFHAERLAALLPGHDKPRVIKRISIIGDEPDFNNFAASMRQAKLEVEVHQTLPPAGAMQGVELVLLARDHIGAADTLRTQMPRETIACLVPIGVPALHYSANQVPGLPYLIHGRPYALRRYLQVIANGASPEKVASMLRFGRGIGRAVVCSDVDVAELTARIISVGRLITASLRKQGMSDTEVLAIERSFGLSQARPSTDEEEGADEVSHPAGRHIRAVMVNEAARMMEDGIVSRSSDIDLMLVHACGYPAWRGGPMYEADVLGAECIVADLAEAARENANPAWMPVPLLVELARTKSALRDFKKSG